MYDERTSSLKQVAADLRSFFGSQVFETIVPRNVRLAEAPSHGSQSYSTTFIVEAQKATYQLAKEVIANGQKRIGAGAGSVLIRRIRACGSQVAGGGNRREQRRRGTVPRCRQLS